MKKTLRQLLNEKSFDWQSGKILIQSVASDTSPGCVTDMNEITSISYVSKYDTILDKKIELNAGLPQCYRFIAEDKEKIYFPVQYDGNVWIEVIYKDLNNYFKVLTPYCGKS